MLWIASLLILIYIYAYPPFPFIFALLLSELGCLCSVLSIFILGQTIQCEPVIGLELCRHEQKTSCEQLFLSLAAVPPLEHGCQSCLHGCT